MLGGLLLLTFMSEFFAPALLIPLHGFVQLGSNSYRTAINFPSMNRKIVLLFASGVGFGAAIGSQFIVNLPEFWYRIILAGFILLMTWLPKPNAMPQFKFKWPVLGACISFLSLFIGATGPVLAPFFIREKLDKVGIVATKAGCQSFIHTAKVITFITLGFSPLPYKEMLLAMLVATFVGNSIGKKILLKIPENAFRLSFKIVITFLCFRMLWKVF